ncbi:flagellar assembly protein FliH [Fredinandcohnia humi]
MSNIIKSNAAKSNDVTKRVIELKMLRALGNEPVAEETVDPHLVAQKIIEDAKKQAAQIVQAANTELSLVRQQVQREQSVWEAERQELYNKTTEEGFESGIREGREAGYAEYKDLLAEAKQIINASKKDFDVYLESAEEVILKLAIKVAEKVIGIHLANEPNDFIHLVKHAVKEVKEHSDISIHVSPHYYQFVVGQKEELIATLGRETDIFIYPQEDLANTDCVIESSFGKINASVDSQLTELKEKLLSLLLEE